MNFQNKVTLPVMQEKITKDNYPSATEHGYRVAWRSLNTLDARATDQS